MEVKQVTEDSWIFETPRRYGRYFSYDSCDEQDGSNDEGIPLKLPPEVAKLGKGHYNFVHEFALPSRSVVPVQSLRRRERGVRQCLSSIVLIHAEKGMV